MQTVSQSRGQSLFAHLWGHEARVAESPIDSDVDEGVPIRTHTPPPPPARAQRPAKPRTRRPIAKFDNGGLQRADRAIAPVALARRAPVVV
jgi:hypothetical protein